MILNELNKNHLKQILMIVEECLGMKLKHLEMDFKPIIMIMNNSKEISRKRSKERLIKYGQNHLF